MPTAYASNDEFIAWMRAHGIPVVSAEVVGATRVFAVRLDSSQAKVFGNKGERTLRIPMDTPAVLCPVLARQQLRRGGGASPKLKR
jgi:hypothetical protein